MAYIVTAETTIEPVATTTLDVAIPAGHQADDIIFAFIGQDTGSTNITTAASGWNLIGTQSAAQAQRAVVYWRRATSSSEPDVTFTGTSATWAIYTVIVRGCPTSTSPINEFNRTDSANSTSNSLTSGTVTTTVDNCLVFSFINFDGTPKLTPADYSQVTPIFKENAGANVAVLTYFNQITAGTTSAVQYLSEVASEGGTVWTIAVEDANPSTAKLSPTISTAYQVVNRYGGITTATTSTAAFIRHNIPTFQQLSSIAATSINGLSVLDTAFTQVAYQSIQQVWGSMTGIQVAVSAIDNTGRWVGATHAISATDFSNKIIHLEWGVSDNNTARFGPQGCALYLQDSTGQWAAYQLSQRQGILANNHYVTHIDTAATPLDESGSIDLTDITRVAFLYHRRTTATNALIIRVQNFLLLDKLVMVDGCPESPVGPSQYANFYSGHGPFLAATVQGFAQGLPRAGLRAGNGSRKTYVDYTASSTEFPLRANASLARRFWKVSDNAPGAEIEIYASANDTVNITSCVLATDTRQTFRINPSTSTSATYNFAGSSIVNWNVLNNVITFNENTFNRCDFTLNGGGLDSCNLINCGPVVTNNPEKITNTNFTSPGTGHAITITATGTWDFEGNTFTGYGADASTDAAIFNDSGGLVTLNLAAGDTVPTVRNGVGASTVINAAPVTVSATILADSRVEIFNTTTSTQIENKFETTTSYSYSITTEATSGDTIRIRVTKKGYIPFETSAIFSPAGIGFIVNQVLDDVYAAYGIDGETVTKFDPDYLNNQIDLNIASNFSAAEFYNWYNYNLTTTQGIEEFFGGLTAIDPGNIRINNTVVNLFFDNITATNVFQNDNIRIFRADAGYPVINPTTGGGGIDLVWRNQVYTVNVGGSSLTPTEQAQLANVNTISTRIDGLIENVGGDRFTAKALEEAGGGAAPSEADIYTYFTSSSRQDAFKADVSGLATQASVDAIPTNPVLTTDTRLDNLDAPVSDTATTAELTIVNNGVKKASLLVPHTDDI